MAAAARKEAGYRPSYNKETRYQPSYDTTQPAQKSDFGAVPWIVASTFSVAMLMQWDLELTLIAIGMFAFWIWGSKISMASLGVSALVWIGLGVALWIYGYSLPIHLGGLFGGFIVIGIVATAVQWFVILIARLW